MYYSITIFANSGSIYPKYATVQAILCLLLAADNELYLGRSGHVGFCENKTILCTCIPDRWFDDCMR